jgi:hypothetical protein
MTDRPVAGRRESLSWFAAASILVVVAGLGMPAAEAAPSWRTRGYEMVQSHDFGTFWGATGEGTTKRNPARIRLEVRWTAHDGEAATLEIHWGVDCYSKSRNSRWSRADDDWKVRLSSGDTVTRTYKASMHICNAHVWAEPWEAIPAGTLEVWVKEKR